MNAAEEFQFFTEESDEEADVDESDSEDPDFRIPVWESSDQSESFGSFVDEEVEEELNHEEQQDDLFEERAEQERKKSDDEGESVNPRAKRVNPPTPKAIYDSRGRPQLDLYQLYENHRHFKHALIEYAILHGFEFKKIKASSSRQTYKCRAEGCPWRIHASTSPCKTYFMVKSFISEHKCQAIRNNIVASSAWIAKVLATDFRDDPTMSLANIRQKLKDRHGLTNLTDCKLFRAKMKAKGGTIFSHTDEFMNLRRYAHMVLTTNLGSKAIIQSDATGNPPHFRRPIIGLDGCHLKGPYGGILLAAIGLDGNLQFFPLAYAIVEVEGSDSWTWFIRLLVDALGRDLQEKPWCIISDRQKGLVQAVQAILPHCSHRMCCHHILKNFQTRHRQAGLTRIFWEAAKAPNVYEFQAAMKNIKTESKDAFEWLDQLEVRSWAFHAMDPRVKCDHVTSNFVESFNAWVGEDRYKPPITMLETIRSKILNLIYTRQQTAGRWNQHLTPDVYAKGKCDCNAWQMTGIPCVHALACISFIRANVDDYIHTYFTTEVWRRSFASVVHPIPSRIYWPHLPDDAMLQPPIRRRIPGRPKIHRNRKEGDKRPVTTRSTTVTCKLCKQAGHNKRSCAQNPNKGKANPPPKKKKQNEVTNTII
ncbi:hypothetical protein UlMin_020799 [Ulmus minor]